MKLRNLPRLAGPPLLSAAIITLAVGDGRGSEVTLELDAGQGEWAVWATISDDTSDTAPLPIVGIAAFVIDVWGEDGVTVTTSVNDSPADDLGAGFSLFRSNHDGPPGMGIHAAQPTLFGEPSRVIDGVGLLPGSQGDASWQWPVQLASGSYSGERGTLLVETVDPDETRSGFTLLFGKDGTWTGTEVDETGGGDVITADVVHGAQITVGLIPGDFDSDGDVDGDDFLIWQSGFGSTDGAQLSDGDSDGDGDVDGDDFLSWQVNFGTESGSPGSGESTAVPEPACMGLAIGLLLTAGLGPRIAPGRG